MYLKGYSEDDATEWQKKWVDTGRDKNSWEKICDYVLDDEFIEENWRDYKTSVDDVFLTEHPELAYFGFFLKYCRKMVFGQHKFVWTPQAANQYKCVVLTYIMRKGLKVPEAYKEWNKYL